MEPTKELIDQLHREEIEDARRLSIAQKLSLSGDLFDSACEVTLSVIKAENPGISSAQALELLRKRLEIARKLETRL